jgi:hypothetical protein
MEDITWRMTSSKLITLLVWSRRHRISCCKASLKFVCKTNVQEEFTASMFRVVEEESSWTALNNETSICYEALVPRYQSTRHHIISVPLNTVIGLYLKVWWQISHGGCPVRSIWLLFSVRVASVFRATRPRWSSPVKQIWYKGTFLVCNTRSIPQWYNRYLNNSSWTYIDCHWSCVVAACLVGCDAV